MEAQLLAGLAALWAVLSSVVGGGFWYLKEQIKIERAASAEREEKAKADCDTRVGRLESKLDEATAIINRQAASQQQQIASQQAMIAALQDLLKESAT